MPTSGEREVFEDGGVTGEASNIPCPLRSNVKMVVGFLFSKFPRPPCPAGRGKAGQEIATGVNIGNLTMTTTRERVGLGGVGVTG